MNFKQIDISKLAVFNRFLLACPLSWLLAQRTAAAVHEENLRYRTEPTQIGVYGKLMSRAGVHALQGLNQENTGTEALFALIDIVLTGAMLLGGSEGIHRMANVFTSFMDGVSTQIDQKIKESADQTPA